MISKIRIRRLGTTTTVEEGPPLHATDTCLDFVSRHALNRHRSFIEHIREIPGIEATGGRVATVGKRSSRRRKRDKRHRQMISKVFIGLSSDEEEGQEEEQRIELVEGTRGQFLTVGMWCSRRDPWRMTKLFNVRCVLRC